MTVCNIDSKDCMYKECVSCNKRCVPLDLINSNVSTEWSEWIYKNESCEKDKKKIIVKKNFKAKNKCSN